MPARVSAVRGTGTFTSTKTFEPRHTHSTPLTHDPEPTAERPLVVKPCQTTGPCDPTIGNAQRWWGLQGSAATDYWIENAGHYRVQAVHTKFCLEARDGRAYVSCCSPNHDHVNLVSQLWSPNMHG
jgi:hypothetical protein